jgi:hypothetical protein
MTITRQLVPDDRRADHVDRLFGLHFPLAVEPTVFAFADRLSPDYRGGCWTFHALGNGGFFMHPDADHDFGVASDNGFQGTMSAEAFGITACLYVYSHLSFGGGELAEACARHFHLLRVYMLGHAEVGVILGAID